MMAVPVPKIGMFPEASSSPVYQTANGLAAEMTQMAIIHYTIHLSSKERIEKRN